MLECLEGKDENERESLCLCLCLCLFGCFRERESSGLKRSERKE